MVYIGHFFIQGVWFGVSLHFALEGAREIVVVVESAPSASTASASTSVFAKQRPVIPFPEKTPIGRTHHSITTIIVVVHS
jgi:hypothetical protein